MKSQDRTPNLPDFALMIPGRDFHITFVYDSAENGLRLLQIAQRLVDDFNCDFLFHFALCNYAKFTTRAVAELQQGSAADVILMAATAPLPSAFWRWFKEWAAQRRNTPTALAVDLRGEAGGQFSALREICAANGVEIMSGLAKASYSHHRDSGGTDHEKTERDPEAVAGDVGASAGFSA